jgi:hypothetical protein
LGLGAWVEEVGDLEAVVARIIPEDFWGGICILDGGFRKLSSGFCFCFVFFSLFTASGLASFVVAMFLFFFSLLCACAFIITPF